MSRKTAHKKGKRATSKRSHINTKQSKLVPQNKWILGLDENKIVFILAVLIFTIALSIRFFAFSAYLMGDEATYATLGKKAMMGLRPYTDFYEMKPPLLYYVYGFGTSLFGWSHNGIRLFGVFAVMLNTALFFIIARKISRTSFALMGAALALFFMQNVYTYAVETVSEHFLLSFLLAGYYFLLVSNFKNHVLRIILAGFFIMGAAMIKQTASVYGLIAIIVLISEHYRVLKFRQIFTLVKNLGFLAIGALLMMLLNLLPVIISGSFKDMVYWMFEFPAIYAASNDLKDSFLYLSGYFGRIFSYQAFSISLMGLILLYGLIFAKHRFKYVFYLLIIGSILFIIPGLRFYGQYWIPLFMLSPFIIVILLERTKKRTVTMSYKIFLPVLIFLSVIVDLGRNHNQYYEKGYRRNTEFAHSGNFIIPLYSILDDLNNRIRPENSFTLLGTQIQSYIALDKFPMQKHIYPKIIGRETSRNKVFQEEAYDQLVEMNPDYIIFSVTANSWASSSNFDDSFYTKAFRFVLQGYDPILAFNTDELKYYSAERGDEIIISRPNQIISFKRKDL